MVVNDTEKVPTLTPDAARRELPYAVMDVLLGAPLIKDYFETDAVGIAAVHTQWALSAVDFETVQGVVDEIRGELNMVNLYDARELMRVHRIASRKVDQARNFLEGTPNPKMIAMLKDNTGSGWWRMMLPSRHMDIPNCRIDITDAAIDFDQLLEYDTIFVQRTHTWDGYYALQRLASAGKRIVYDIDDDMFNITPDNPSYGQITRDDQRAAAACMKLADVVTTTTARLAQRLAGVVNGVNPVVIPNSMDTQDNWLPWVATGSPDEWKRLFWSGGASHAEDWMECFGAVEAVMKARDDVRLVIMGYLPPVVQYSISKPHFAGRIEYVGFEHPETYYEMIHHVRADVALAPLRPTEFNGCKSAIKFLEYSLIGIPTVASDTPPYSDVIEDKKNGRLVSGEDEWVKAINFLLDKDSKRRDMVKEARSTCEGMYDIKSYAQRWENVLTGSSDEVGNH